MDEQIKNQQRLRISFLNKLYELSGGDTHDFINGAEVAFQIGIQDGNEDCAIVIADYLEHEELIKSVKGIGGFPMSIRITHKGIKEIEGALKKPDQPTEHFMPINILNVGQIVGSNIQQGTKFCSQNINLSPDFLRQIKEFIDEIIKSKSDLSLTQNDEKELDAELTTVEAQILSPKPKSFILKEGLESIKRILESAVGSAIGTALAAKIPLLLALL